MDKETGRGYTPWSFGRCRVDWGKNKTTQDTFCTPDNASSLLAHITIKFRVRSAAYPSPRLFLASIIIAIAEGDGGHDRMDENMRRKHVWSEARHSTNRCKQTRRVIRVGSGCNLAETLYCCFIRAVSNYFGRFCVRSRSCSIQNMQTQIHK